MSLDIYKESKQTEIRIGFTHQKFLMTKFSSAKNSRYMVLYLGEENRCFCTIHHDSIAIHSQSIYRLLNRQPANSDSFSLMQPVPQALLQGWRVGSHKVAGKGYINTENSQIISIGAIFNSTYHTKQLNPWPNSPSSYNSDLQLAMCLSSHLKTT